jgi:hypothetical protein
MNGLDSEPYIGSVYGMDKVLYAVSVGIDALRDGNRVSYSKPGTHFFGEAVAVQHSGAGKRNVSTHHSSHGKPVELPDRP